jgi:type IV pilus assembly protein PilB
MRKPEKEPEEEFLSLQEAAQFLFVSKSTLYRLLNQGKLRGMKAGKQWRFRKADLVAYMQRGPAALALANLPIEVLDGELAAFREYLAEAGTSAEQSDDSSLAGEAGKISQLVRRMVWLLHTYGGSDISVEPMWEAGREYTRLRMRVNGELRDAHEFPFSLHEPLVLEWKQQAGLSIEERSRPQDGSARLTYGETLVALRVSVVPTVYGERVAVRDIPTRVPSLDELGMGDTPLRDWSARPRGLVLITSPTGHGKSTTRAACVRERDAYVVNIMAVDDQIEYLFPSGVAQLKAERFTSAEGVRAILTQDPDVIAVGDLLTDAALAQAAMLAAETGHLVLACVHAYDSISPLYDLVELGVKRPQLAGNLIGIVNQHLLSKLCDACKDEQVPDGKLLAEIRESSEAGGYPLPEGAVFYGPVGCEACRDGGYTGRFPVHEYFTFSPAVKAAFLRGATAEELTKLARAEGQISTFAAAVRAAAEGRTSLDEAMRRIPEWRG